MLVQEEFKKKYGDVLKTFSNIEFLSASKASWNYRSLINIAEGETNIFVYPYSGKWIWDLAPLQAILEGAGGHIVTLTNERLIYNSLNISNGFIAGDSQNRIENLIASKVEADKS